MGDGGRAVLLGVASVVGAFVLYAGALGHPFLGDDQLAVSGNPTVARPSGTGFRALWVTDYWRGVAPDGQVTEMSTDRNLFRPVTIASFWLTSWIAGIDPMAFRVGNVVLHALAATLIGLLCVAMGWRRGGIVAAAFVLVHPVATDVVNRIVGRADVLAVVGVAACLVVQCRAHQRGWTGMRALGAFVAALVALGAKESGVVLVPLALFHGWLLGGLSSGRSAGPQWLGMTAIGSAVAAYLLGRMLAVDLPTYVASTWDLGGNPVWGAGLDVRLPVAGALAWHYARLIVWPTPLIAFDVPPWVPTWSTAEAWLGVGLLGALAAVLVVTTRRRHPASLGIAWWLLSFLIVSQLLVPIGAYREVRFAYAMVAGSALVVGCLCEQMAARAGAVRALGAGAVLAGIVLATSVVWQRNADFHDLQTLLAADVRQRPASPAALIRLANIHDRAGRADEAERVFARVIELAPTSAQACYEFADFHGRHGRADRARALHERAIALNPSHHLSLMALWTMALGERDLERAQAFLTRAAAAAPDNPFVIYNLAVLDDARGERARALARLTALVARRPDFSLAVRGLEKLRADEARKGRR